MLVSLDSHYGNDTHTLDNDSNLLWLDLEITAGRSFNDVNSQPGSGGEFEGYRYATLDEVLQLWTYAAIPDITTDGPIVAGDFTAANLAPSLSVAQLIGVTNAFFFVRCRNDIPRLHQQVTTPCAS